MMKKIIFCLLCALAMTTNSYAVPAYPYPVNFTQPDGRVLVIQGHGDEFYNFTTTADGYTIVKNDAGFFTYATMVDGKLAATNLIARNEGERSATDIAYLATVKPMMHETTAAASANKARQNVVAPKESDEYYKNFRGLIVLVEFTDRQFLRSDAQEFYGHMFNDENYSGYVNEDGSPAQLGTSFIGGVRDYFYQNSNGIFCPQFDVAGPVMVDKTSTTVGGSSGGRSLFKQALQKLEATGFDFSKYDADDDGNIDMMFFIAAGYGSNYSGNYSGYLWPHKSTLYYDNLVLDGKRAGTYACNIELYGLEGSTILEGIGTICHEFSHVIGLPDLYDTNYDTYGQANHPGGWDIMASGGYSVYGRRPVGYSAYERYASGFIKPKYITEPGAYTIGELQSTGDMYILPTANDKEYFILENRQKNSWDASLLGHGMLVARLDSSNVTIWRNNQVNAYADHMYYELLRAGGKPGGGTADPFPGTKNVMLINNRSDANLLTWDGKLHQFCINNIEESNGVISFVVARNADELTLTEDFEAMGASGTTATSNVEGTFTNWTFTKCALTAVASETQGNGDYCVAMIKPSALTTDYIRFHPHLCTVTLSNPSSTAAKFKLQMQTEGETTWSDCRPAEVSVNGGEKITATFVFSAPSATKFRLYQYGGSTTGKTYIDDLTFYYNKLKGDVNNDGDVNVGDVTDLVNFILEEVLYFPEYDINDDEEINIADVTELINIILAQ